ncbi:MAG TPA: 2-C-methyl-D-erythritol 2,4-cyclodiphosphate synthase [Clostridia bacterium]|nr:2-C-methyl-D-erythritol 2,4-cyclodiphosphate synthase [Clostridia bacterium]
MRVGIGYDAHRLVKGRPLILGGCKIPYDLGLLGHSDADVLIHAIMDALLGAACLGDLGRHFPDTDDRYKDIDSGILLTEVKRLVGEKGFKIVNLDSIIICQRPKLAPYLEQMRGKIAFLLELNPEQINIKATTTENLGFTGRGEGIAAQAVVLLESVEKNI